MNFLALGGVCVLAAWAFLLIGFPLYLYGLLKGEEFNFVTWGLFLIVGAQFMIDNWKWCMKRHRKSSHAEGDAEA